MQASKGVKEKEKTWIIPALLISWGSQRGGQQKREAKPPWIDSAWWTAGDSNPEPTD